MDDASQAREKWQESSEAWIAGMVRGDPNRTHLLDGVMLDCLGEVRGLEIVDVGCGEGRFCRMLASRGARVVGLDLIPRFIDEAQRRHPDGSYREGSAEALPFENESFDWAVSYIVLVDIADYRAAIREMARVVKPGGRILVANVNSFASTSPTGWVRNSAGGKIHFPVDRYFEERPLLLHWSGMSILNWHRPLTAYMTAFLEEGLILSRFLEPQPSEDAIREIPSMADETRIALFNVMVWTKPVVA